MVWLRAATPRSQRRRKRRPLSADWCGNVSSLSRDARVVFNALQRDAGVMAIPVLSGAQMLGEHVPHRRPLLLVDRGPSGHPVTLAGVKLMTIVEPQLGNSAPDRLGGRASIRHAADADHVAALLIIRVGIEQVVADIFEDVLDLAAGHRL